MSNLIRRLSSRLSRLSIRRRRRNSQVSDKTKCDHGDDPKKSEDVTSPKYYSTDTEPSFIASTAAESRPRPKRFKALRNLVRAASSLFSPRRRHKRANRPERSQSEKTRKVKKIGLDLPPRSSVSLTHAELHRPRASSEFDFFSGPTGSASFHGFPSSRASSMIQQKRRDRRSSNRRMDSILEDTTSDDMWSLDHIGLAAQESPPDSFPSKTYKRGEISKSLNSSSVSPSQTEDDLKKQGRGNETPENSMIKITYISCPFKTPRKADSPASTTDTTLKSENSHSLIDKSSRTVEKGESFSEATFFKPNYASPSDPKIVRVRRQVQKPYFPVLDDSDREQIEPPHEAASPSVRPKVATPTIVTQKGDGLPEKFQSDKKIVNPTKTTIKDFVALAENTGNFTSAKDMLKAENNVTSENKKSVTYSQKISRWDYVDSAARRNNPADKDLYSSETPVSFWSPPPVSPLVGTPDRMNLSTGNIRPRVGHPISQSRKRFFDTPQSPLNRSVDTQLERRKLPLRLQPFSERSVNSVDDMLMNYSMKQNTSGTEPKAADAETDKTKSSYLGKGLRRVRSMNDIEHYERYYRFLLGREDSKKNRKKILDVFRLQLKELTFSETDTKSLDNDMSQQSFSYSADLSESVRMDSSAYSVTDIETELESPPLSIPLEKRCTPKYPCTRDTLTPKLQMRKPSFRYTAAGNMFFTSNSPRHFQKLGMCPKPYGGPTTPMDQSSSCRPVTSPNSPRDPAEFGHCMADGQTPGRQTSYVSSVTKANQKKRYFTEMNLMVD